MGKKINEYAAKSLDATLGDIALYACPASGKCADRMGSTLVKKTRSEFRRSPLDRNDPDYAKRRDERLMQIFSEIERALIPNPRPLTEAAKLVLKTPIGVAPK